MQSSVGIEPRNDVIAEVVAAAVLVVLCCCWSCRRSSKCICQSFDELDQVLLCYPGVYPFGLL